MYNQRWKMLFIEMFVNVILDSRCSFNGDWITKKLGKWILFLCGGTVVRDVFVEMLLEIIEMSLSRSNIGWGTKNTFIQIKIFAFHYFLFFVCSLSLCPRRTFFNKIQWILQDYHFLSFLFLAHWHKFLCKTTWNSVPSKPSSEKTLIV